MKALLALLILSSAQVFAQGAGNTAPNPADDLPANLRSRLALIGVASPVPAAVVPPSPNLVLQGVIGSSNILDSLAQAQVAIFPEGNRPTFDEARQYWYNQLHSTDSLEMEKTPAVRQARTNLTYTQQFFDLKFVDQNSQPLRVGILENMAKSIATAELGENATQAQIANRSSELMNSRWKALSDPEAAKSFVTQGRLTAKLMDTQILDAQAQIRTTVFARVQDLKMRAQVVPEVANLIKTDSLGLSTYLHRAESTERALNGKLTELETYLKDSGHTKLEARYQTRAPELSRVDAAGVKMPREEFLTRRMPEVARGISAPNINKAAQAAQHVHNGLNGVSPLIEGALGGF